jgi:hypothetical protein
LEAAFSEWSMQRIYNDWIVWHSSEHVAERWLAKLLWLRTWERERERDVCVCEMLYVEQSNKYNHQSKPHL